MENSTQLEKTRKPTEKTISIRNLSGEVLREALKTDPMALKFASMDLRGDEEIL